MTFGGMLRKSGGVRAAASVGGALAAFAGGIYAGQAYKWYWREDDGDNSSVSTVGTYDGIAEGYDDKIGFTEWFSGISRMRRRLIRDNAKGRTLEVAAGTSRNAEHYTRNVSSLVFVDASRAMLCECKAKVSRVARDKTWKGDDSEGGLDKNMTVSFVQRDARDLTCFASSSFDTVVQTFGLCSIDDPLAALKEMKRVTRPGGKILLLEHGRSSDRPWLSKFLDRKAKSHYARWGCTWNRDVEKMLDDAGFTPRQVSLHHLGTTYEVVFVKPDAD